MNWTARLEKQREKLGEREREGECSVKILTLPKNDSKCVVFVIKPAIKSVYRVNIDAYLGTVLYCPSVTRLN